MGPEWVDVFPIENGDVIPASYVSLPEGTSSDVAQFSQPGVTMRGMSQSDKFSSTFDAQGCCIDSWNKHRNWKFQV